MNDFIEIKQRTPAFYLTWVINNICTNACSYCPTNLHDGTNHHYEWEHAERLADYLISKHERINLALSGGEPTLSPWLKDLVKKFSDAGHSVGMTSNGARTVRYFRDISQYLSYIVLSYHPSFEDPELIDKALACAENTYCTISVMFDSRHFDKALAFFNKIREYPSLSAQAIRIHDWNVGNTYGRDYTEEQLEILKNLSRIIAKKAVKPKITNPVEGILVYNDGKEENFNAQILINNHQTIFYGWECNVGLESLYVKFDGMIRLANCPSSTIIGNIRDFDNIRWPDKPFVCPQNFLCHCTTDVYIPKRKI